jgi:hypothetical protein
MEIAACDKKQKEQCQKASQNKNTNTPAMQAMAQSSQEVRKTKWTSK